MGISQKAIDEFKQLYKEQYGEDLTNDIASEAANRLVRFVDLIYKPIPKADEEQYIKIEKEVQEKQANMKESDKLDFVKHLVQDSQLSKLRDTFRVNKRSQIKFEDFTIFDLGNGQEIKIPTVSIGLKEWKGEAPKNTYGGKQIVDVMDEPLFAELAIRKLVMWEGWNAIWVDSYGKKFRIGLPDKVEPIPFPQDKLALFDEIINKVGRFAGCWDIFAWNRNQVLFVECKRMKKDKIRQSQIRWLKAALESSIPIENFMIVSWDIVKEKPK